MFQKKHPVIIIQFSQVSTQLSPAVPTETSCGAAGDGLRDLEIELLHHGLGRRIPALISCRIYQDFRRGIQIWASLVGGWTYPSEKKRILMTFPIYGKIKHVPNHLFVGGFRGVFICFAIWELMGVR